MRKLVLMLTAVSVAVSVMSTAMYVAIHKPLTIADVEYYEVKSGTTLNGALGDFERRGWIISTLPARLYHRFALSGSHIKQGEYRLLPGENIRQILNRWVEGDVYYRSITLVEGKTVSDYLKQLSVLRLHGDAAPIANLGELATMLEHSGSIEGWIAPDSYLYTRGMDSADILSQAYALQQRRLQAAWALRTPGLPLDTDYELLILASIVEKETGIASERARIAGVFVNRLHKGMRLQTDPTVIYGLGDAYDGNIRKGDLLRPTPYNTYVINGLPPTPISNPGNEALLATAQPEAHDYLYFVGKGDGSHHFSTSLTEHNEAVRRYQLERREDYRSSPR